MLLEQIFQLKMHGDLSFQEIFLLTAEDRMWWIARLNKWNEEQKKAGESYNSDAPQSPKGPGFR
jgi:hypothetical protein